MTAVPVKLLSHTQCVSLYLSLSQASRVRKRNKGKPNPAVGRPFRAQFWNTRERDAALTRQNGTEFRDSQTVLLCDSQAGTWSGFRGRFREWELPLSVFRGRGREGVKTSDWIDIFSSTSRDRDRAGTNQINELVTCWRFKLIRTATAERWSNGLVFIGCRWIGTDDSSQNWLALGRKHAPYRKG